MITLPIPAADPMPLPAPVWLLKSLLLLTFFLHLLFMSGTVGGAVVAVASAIRGETDKKCAMLARRLVGVLPVLMAFTITLGVAAFLFVQVLYGQLIYASSILMGVAWMALIPILIIGYYGLYWASNKSSMRGLGLGVLMVFVIGLIFTNNMTLMLAPERWRAMYSAGAAGLHMNFDELSLVPRYLHMMLGSVAIGGLLVLILGLREKKVEVRAWLLRQGSLWFVIATAGNIVVGFWFLMTLRSEVRDLFMGRSKMATAFMIAGMLLPIGAIVHLVLGLSRKKADRQAMAGIGAALLTVMVMVGMRDLVRAGYLNPVMRPSEMAVSPQWGVIALFLLLFVAGLGTLGWMLKKLATSGAKS
jgi:hypothetical protein